MLNGKAMIVDLIVGYIKKTYDKWLNIFHNWNRQEEKWKLN